VRCIIFTGYSHQHFTEGFQDKIFDTEIITALGHALDHEDIDIRSSAFNFFTAAMAQGKLHFFDSIFIPTCSQRGFETRYVILRSSPHLDMHYVTMKILLSEAAWSISSLLPWLKVRCIVLWNIHTEIFAEGVRHKIFDNGIVPAMRRELVDLNFIRCSAVQFFIAAVAHGALSCFHGIFILKYWQRAFGLTYLILRSSPQLYMHYNTPGSDVAQLNFLLLP